MNSKKVFLFGVAIITGVIAHLLYFSWIPDLEKEFIISSGFLEGFFLLIFYVLLYLFFSTSLIGLLKTFIKLKPADPGGNKGLITGMIMGFWISGVSSLCIGFFILILEMSSFPGKTWSLELIVLFKIILVFSLSLGLIIGLKNELKTFPKKSSSEM